MPRREARRPRLGFRGGESTVNARISAVRSENDGLRQATWRSIRFLIGRLASRTTTPNVLLLHYSVLLLLQEEVLFCHGDRCNSAAAAAIAGESREVAAAARWSQWVGRREEQSHANSCMDGWGGWWGRGGGGRERDMRGYVNWVSPKAATLGHHRQRGLGPTPLSSADQ